jgi:hypothetical protein
MKEKIAHIEAQSASDHESRKRKTKNSDTDLPERVRSRSGTTATENQIDPVRCLLSNGVDQMVYKLYGLTPEEIKIIEGENNK